MKAKFESDGSIVLVPEDGELVPEVDFKQVGSFLVAVAELFDKDGEYCLVENFDSEQGEELGIELVRIDRAQETAQSPGRIILPQAS